MGMPAIMSRKPMRTKNRDQRREEALRPHPRLGYDHDALAVYLISCEAYEIAEPEFRRAIWLNPFEPLFQQHLAMCLRAQGRLDEALECAVEALKQHPSSQEIERTVKLLGRDDVGAAPTQEQKGSQG